MAIRAGYSVEDMNTTLITPLRLGLDPAPPYTPLVGTESLALLMRNEDNVSAFGYTKGSVGGVNGHFHGAQDFVVTPLGRGYHFDGVTDRHIHVHHESFLNSPTFAISLHLKVDGEEGGEGAHIIGRGVEATAPWFLRLDAPGVGRKITFLLRTSSGPFTCSIPAVDFDMRVFRHVMVTVSAGTINIYKNNVLKATTAYTGTPNATADDLYIGASDGTAKRFQGTVKDFRFFATTLSADDRSVLLGESHPKNIHKYLQAWYDAFWSQVDTDIEFAKEQFYVETGGGAFLDKQGRPTQTIRRPGEDDLSYRIRIIIDRRGLFGGVTIDDVIEIVETIVGATTEGSIQVTQNRDTGNLHEPAYFRVDFNTSLLLAQGFTTSELAGVRAEVESQLNKVCAAGVRVQVVLRTGSLWDNGDNWDDPATIWGS